MYSCCSSSDGRIHVEMILILRWRQREVLLYLALFTQRGFGGLRDLLSAGSKQDIPPPPPLPSVDPYGGVTPSVRPPEGMQQAERRLPGWHGSSAAFRNPIHGKHSVVGGPLPLPSFSRSLSFAYERSFASLNHWGLPSS